MIGGLVLAAGGGRRFGGPKQLAALGGVPLLERVLANATAAPGVVRWLVVLGAGAESVLQGVELHGAEPVRCAEWRRGQAESLRCGIERLEAEEAAVIVLGDQPLVSAAAIERVLAARSGDAPAVRATYGGSPGHPVLVERELFARLTRLRGDAGARGVLAEVGAREVPCDDVADPADVDSPADLAAIEARL